MTKKKVKLLKSNSKQQKAVEPERKKSPKDYPLFAFRVSQDDKDDISATVDKLVALSNRSRTDDRKLVRRNDIIVDALKEGLEVLRQRRK
jgi:hypothetical protein